MADTTNENVMNALRARRNMDDNTRNEADEAAIEQAATFLLATAENIQSPRLKSFMNDIANDFIKNKSTLANGAGMEEEEEPMEAAAGPLPPGLLGAAGGVAPGMTPPGLMPPGQGMPAPGMM
jgi:hypothetical protein